MGLIAFCAFRWVLALSIKTNRTNLEFLTHKLTLFNVCFFEKIWCLTSSSCVCRMFASATEVQIRWKVFHRVRIQHTAKRLRRRLVRVATRDYSTTLTKNTALVREQRTHSVIWRPLLTFLAQLLQRVEFLKLILFTMLFLLRVC